jgi:hypothetical protein
MDRGARPLAGLILLFLLGVGSFILSIIAVSYASTNHNDLNHFLVGYPASNGQCNDYDACTEDRVINDNTCIYRPRVIGFDCSKEDVCYGNATNKHCCDDGKCISSRRNCIGICPNNGFQYQIPSNCTLNLFPLNFAQFDSTFLSCVYGSCTLTAIQFWAERRALDDSYLFNVSSCNKNANFKLSKCISYFCTTNTGTAVCIFRYTCATYNLTNNVMDSALTATDDNSTNYTHIIDFPAFGDSIDRKTLRSIEQEYNTKLKKTLDNM